MSLETPEPERRTCESHSAMMPEPALVAPNTQANEKRMEAESESERNHTAGTRTNPGANGQCMGKRRGGKWWSLVGAAAAAFLAYFLWFAPSTPDGPDHPNYKHHIQDVATQIVVSDNDLDQRKTDALRESLKRGVQRPELAMLTPGMRQKILNGDAHFYHLTLFDDCDEDGDVVRLLINGLPVGEVSILHAGTTLSVPLVAGETSQVSIVGVRDGGGGITVAFRTSEGHFYARRLQVGERMDLATVSR